MLGRSLLLAGLALAVVTPAPAQTPPRAVPQTAACAKEDLECRAADAVLRTLDANATRTGLPEYVIGTFCKIGPLAEKGRRQYAAVLPSLIGVAERETQRVLAEEPSARVDVLKARAATTLRAARHSQTAGMVAGMDSVFAMYPRSREEYCAVMGRNLGG